MGSTRCLATKCNTNCTGTPSGVTSKKRLGICYRSNHRVDIGVKNRGCIYTVGRLCRKKIYTDRQQQTPRSKVRTPFPAIGVQRLLWMQTLFQCECVPEAPAWSRNRLANLVRDKSGVTLCDVLKSIVF